jgi:hypothetical protein
MRVVHSSLRALVRHILHSLANRVRVDCLMKTRACTQNKVITTMPTKNEVGRMKIGPNTNRTEASILVNL